MSEMPSEIWAYREVIDGERVDCGTGTWIDEFDGDDGALYVRKDIDRARRQELADALDEVGGYKYSVTDFEHRTTWHEGKMVPDELAAELLAYLRAAE